MPARICWLGYGERARWARRSTNWCATADLKAPIAIGRDHLDTGSVASPYRETEGMKDGSDAVADWPILNALLNTASGASWVSFHHGGGVGIGYSLHAGQVTVADGTADAVRKVCARAQKRSRASASRAMWTPATNRRRRRPASTASASPWKGSDVASYSSAVVNIGQLVTLAGPARPRVGGELSNLAIIRDAAMLIEDGRITALGTFSEIKSKGISQAVVDAERRCITPGFVDAHTHLVFAGNRAAEFEQRIAGATYQELAAAGGGILRTVASTRTATEDELLSAARRHRDWMLRSGTTTIEAKSGYGLDRETELKMLRVIRRLNDEGPARIVPTLLAAHTVPPEFADRRAEYVRWVSEELIPEVAATGLAQFCDAFCDDHAFTEDETRGVLTSARIHGMKLRVHAEQFRPGTGADVAAELCAATADHLETATDETLQRLRAAGSPAGLAARLGVCAAPNELSACAKDG